MHYKRDFNVGSKKMLSYYQQDPNAAERRGTLECGALVLMLLPFSCRVHEEQGVTMLVDKVSYEFLKGATIEFSEDLISASFQVCPTSLAIMCAVARAILPGSPPILSLLMCTGICELCFQACSLLAHPHVGVRTLFFA